MDANYKTILAAGSAAAGTVLVVCALAAACVLVRRYSGRNRTTNTVYVKGSLVSGHSHRPSISNPILQVTKGSLLEAAENEASSASSTTAQGSKTYRIHLPSASRSSSSSSPPYRQSNRSRVVPNRKNTAPPSGNVRPAHVIETSDPSLHVHETHNSEIRSEQADSSAENSSAPDSNSLPSHPSSSIQDLRLSAGTSRLSEGPLKRITSTLGRRHFFSGASGPGPLVISTEAAKDISGGFRRKLERVLAHSSAAGQHELDCPVGNSDSRWNLRDSEYPRTPSDLDTHTFDLPQQRISSRSVADVPVDVE